MVCLHGLEKITASGPWGLATENVCRRKACSPGGHLGACRYQGFCQFNIPTMEFQKQRDKVARLSALGGDYDPGFPHQQYSPGDGAASSAIGEELESLAIQRHYVLELGKDLTQLRDKDDLIALFSTRIKEFFYFNHSIITLVDEQRQSYSPFLLNPSASPLVRHQDYDELVASHFRLDEPFIQRVVQSAGPVLFDLEKVMDEPGAPPFLRANFEVGLKTILMTPLRHKGKTIGFLHAYSDTDHTFTKALIAIIRRIAPQISNSVANILINEENEKKQRVDDALLALGHKLSVLKDKAEVLQTLCTALKKFIAFDYAMITISGERAKQYRIFLSDLPDAGPVCGQALSESSFYPVADELYSAAAYSFFPLVFDMELPRQQPLPQWYCDAKALGCREMLMKILPNSDTNCFGLVLFGRGQNTFDESATGIIETLSAHLSGVLQNLLGMEAMASKEREKSFLLDFSSELAAVRTRGNLQQVILDTLARFCDASQTVISLLGDKGDLLVPYLFDSPADRGKTGGHSSLIKAKFPVGDPCYRRLLDSEGPLVFRMRDDQGDDSALMAWWKKTGADMVFAIALRVGQQNLGMLWLVTSDVNAEILKGICAQISIAIFNIRAYEQLLGYKQQLEKENDHLHEQISTLLNFSEIVGDGPAMKQVYEKMELVAPSNSTVIILGETGTGKELIARAIHQSSLRSGRKMIKVNCAALPAHLIESELFGHEKGAFTGASEKRAGKFELADGGSIFLDEIGELPLDLQVKLLRVIQEREFERVGGSVTIKVDIRIIAATNRDLAAEVSAGKFRADLYYRLHVFPITLPALSARKEDIPALAHYFLQRSARRVGRRVSSICPKVMQRLLDYPWPGNIRELEHLIERSILLNTGQVLSVVHLPDASGQNGQQEVMPSRTLEQMEREHIVGILKKCSGKISGGGGAADLLEIPASTLHSKMKKLSITRADYHPLG